MSKTLYLFIVRHGHAEFDASSDFSRSLNNKGINAVKDTAQFIQSQCVKQHLTPSVCLSSAAKRTLETAAILNKNFKDLNIQPYQELYASSVSTWLKLIENSFQESLILVGHNPTFSQIINYFCGKNVQMKPAECALIKLKLKSDGIIYPATLINYHYNE